MGLFLFLCGFFIFGVVVVPGVVVVFGGTGVHCIFGWTACCILAWVLGHPPGWSFLLT